MASIRKKGKKFLAEVRVKGFYASKAFDSKLDAQAWAIEQERNRGKHKDKPVVKTLGQALDRYVKEISPTHKGQRWERVRVEKLKRDTVADITLHDLTTDDLQGWVDRQSTSGGTVQRDFTLIRATLIESYRKWKWIDREPHKHVRLPKGNPSRDRRVSDLEISKVLDALGYTGEVNSIRDKIAVAMLLAVETAMRQGEIWGLDWKHVFLKERFVTLPETKNGSKRDVPLSTRAVKLLESLPGPRTGRVIKCQQASSGTIFRRAVKMAEIEDLHFHDLRHEATTRLAQRINHKDPAKRISVLDLARITGHKDLRSLQIYFNPTVQELASKLD